MPGPRRSHGRLVLYGLISIALAVAVAGCGKRGKPKPPENQTVTHPKTYPTR